ncbi:MAG: 16S rRNA processing protein RimM [Cyclobacteriaceae bacterium]|nr:16S rRNA processing protein RimM [Cyclobacteriaceae bacterium]UYN86520.1 MAG: 16S rRNA processing protein RimM [Cyclobacteriaceae bacterium]
MKKEDCYKAGFIMRPHGLKGEVTVSLDPDSPADWGSLQSVLIENHNTLVPYFIENVSVKNDKAFIKFEDVSTPEEATRLKNLSIYLLKSSRPKLTVADFYDDEIIGFDVNDQTLGLLGKVVTLERAGVNRFIILDHKGKDVMIPAQPPLVKSVNRAKKVISVNLPDGFLDI